MRPQRNKSMRAPGTGRTVFGNAHLEHYAIKLPEALAHSIQRLGGGDLSVGVLVLYEKYKAVGGSK